jgi:hypothetical protein
MRSTYYARTATSLPYDSCLQLTSRLPADDNSSHYMHKVLE